MDLWERFESAHDRCYRLLGKKEAIESELESNQDEIKDLKLKKDLYFRTVEVLKKLIEKTTERDLQKVERFVSMGLHEVIDDQRVHCKIACHPKAGASKVTITGYSDGVEGPFLENFGGGVWNVASVVLRIMTILRMKLRKRLFLDESLNNLSVSYQENMSALLRSLVAKMDFVCLLISHQERFAEAADHLYVASLKNNELVLRKEK